MEGGIGMNQEPIERINEVFAEMDWQALAEEHDRYTHQIVTGMSEAIAGLLPHIKSVIDVMSRLAAIPEIRQFIAMQKALETGQPLWDFDRRIIRRRKRKEMWRKRR